MWLQLIQFELLRAHWFRMAGVVSDEANDTAIHAFVAFLKASCILNDIIAQHPVRIYITFGHRQAPISILAAAVDKAMS
jgi:hypothetical protein